MAAMEATVLSHTANLQRISDDIRQTSIDEPFPEPMPDSGSASDSAESFYSVPSSLSYHSTTMKLSNQQFSRVGPARTSFAASHAAPKSNSQPTLSASSQLRNSIWNPNLYRSISPDSDVKSQITIDPAKPSMVPFNGFINHINPRRPLSRVKPYVSDDLIVLMSLESIYDHNTSSDDESVGPSSTDPDSDTPPPPSTWISRSSAEILALRDQAVDVGEIPYVDRKSFKSNSQSWASKSSSPSLDSPVRRVTAVLRTLTRTSPELPMTPVMCQFESLTGFKTPSLTSTNGPFKHTTTPTAISEKRVTTPVHSGQEAPAVSTTPITSSTRTFAPLSSPASGFSGSTIGSPYAYPSVGQGYCFYPYYPVVYPFGAYSHYGNIQYQNKPVADQVTAPLPSTSQTSVTQLATYYQKQPEESLSSSEVRIPFLNLSTTSVVMDSTPIGVPKKSDILSRKFPALIPQPASSPVGRKAIDTAQAPSVVAYNNIDGTDDLLIICSPVKKGKKGKKSGIHASMWAT